MGRIRRTLAFALAAAGIAAGAIGSGAPASANGLDAACTYTVTNQGVNNGFVVVSYGNYRVYADHRVQLRTGSCAAQVRAAVNFRCLQYVDPAGWSTTPCGAAGNTQLHKNPGATTWTKSYSFASTGPDGTTTVYTDWVNRGSPCSIFYSELYVDTVTIGGRTFTVQDFVGSSHDYFYCF